jgi:hypothetical protein
MAVGIDIGQFQMRFLVHCQKNANFHACLRYRALVFLQDLIIVCVKKHINMNVALAKIIS